MNHLDPHFHRAQTRLRSQRKAIGGGKAVHPAFFSATGDSSYYEIPAYMRKRVQQLTLENASRLAAYVDRAQADMERVA